MSRLDQALVERGFFTSRSRARDAVKRGTVAVNDESITKPAQIISTDDRLSVTDATQHYVSRAAGKLIAGLDHFDLDVSGRRALDIGASTGGFTQVLLERGAVHVTAIDVGHGQMDARLLDDPRVHSLEGVNARYMTDSDMAEPVSCMVSDVSFISLELALPACLKFAAPDCIALFLVKPQFEVGREGVGRGGIVRSIELGFEAAEGVKAWLSKQSGWRVLGLTPCPLVGGDGNQEYLLGAMFDGA